MPIKIVKRCLIAALIFGLLVFGAYGGYVWYKRVRQAHLVNQARQFLNASDYKNSLLSLQRAILHNPRDPDTCRLMADLAEATHSPSMLLWRSRVVENNPGSLNDRLAWAEAAIRQRDFATATDSLDGVKAADRNTAAYQSVAGALAASVKQPGLAESHFREAARLDPSNLVPLLNIAVLQLQGSNAPASNEGRSFLRKLSLNPTNADLRLKALRELTVDAMRHHETNAALALSKDLLQQTNSGFADQVLHLDALSDTGSSQFKPALASAQRDASADPAKVARLASWQVTKFPPGEVLLWLKSLPLASQTNQAVAVVLAGCYSRAGDWPGLQTFLARQDWHELDFMRHAFLARSWRGQELAATQNMEWQSAISKAKSRKENLLMLLSMATQWNWSNEAEELLMTIVNQYPADKAAFDALAHTLFLEGRTRSLLDLYKQAFRREPSSLATKNNLALIALLLDAQDLTPHDLAWQVFQQAPTNSACVSTYALSLLLQKKNPEALRVLERLDPLELTTPSVAAYYGLALRANGNAPRAKHYIEFASRALMLPEQRKLLADTGP